MGATDLLVDVPLDVVGRSKGRVWRDKQGCLVNVVVAEKSAFLVCFVQKILAYQGKKETSFACPPYLVGRARGEF